MKGSRQNCTKINGKVAMTGGGHPEIDGDYYNATSEIVKDDLSTHSPVIYQSMDSVVAGSGMDIMLENIYSLN